MVEPWTSLRDAHAAGESSELLSDSIHDRRVEFEDGVVWFPDGVPAPQGSTLGPASLFGLLIVSGSGSLVLFMDDHPWFVMSVVPTSVLALGLVLLLWRSARLERAAEARLDRGVFLLPDAVVLRRQGEETRIPRASIERFEVRHRTRGDEASTPWIYVVRRGDADVVPLDLTERSLGVLKAWRSPAG